VKKRNFILLLIAILIVTAWIAILEGYLINEAYTPVYQVPLKLPLFFPLFFLPVAGLLGVSLYYLWCSKQKQNELLLEEAAYVNDK